MLRVGKLVPLIVVVATWSGFKTGTKSSMTFQTWSSNSRILAPEGLVMAVLWRTAKIARRCSRSLSNIMYVAFHLVGTSCSIACCGKSNCFWRDLSSLEARELLLKWPTSFLTAAAALEISLILSPALTLSCRVCAKQRICGHSRCVVIVTILAAISVVMPDTAVLESPKSFTIHLISFARFSPVRWSFTSIVANT